MSPLARQSRGGRSRRPVKLGSARPQRKRQQAMRSLLFEHLETRNLLSTTPVQYFYVPFPEGQLLQGLQAIESGGAAHAPVSPITSDISIAAVADDTIIYYDQWENGYDADIANPKPLQRGQPRRHADLGRRQRRPTERLRGSPAT